MIAGIVVLYKPEEKDIDNLKQYIGKVDYLLVLDNSAEDNYRRVNGAVQIDGCHVIYEHFNKNIGLCAALNYGVSAAQKKGCQWALLMDEDSSLATDIVGVYKRYIEQNDTSDTAVLAPVHLYDRSNASGYAGCKRVRWAMTSGCLYNIALFEKSGGFLEELFVEGLDLDYCYRAGESGYQVIECGEAQLLHHPAKTAEFRLFNKITLFKYGYADSHRYFMQARSLVWLIFRYRHLENIIMYFWKWFKVIFLFPHKMDYCRNMVRGSKEGYQLWKKCKKIK